MSTSHKRKAWKEYMVNRWDKLVQLCHRTSSTPSFKLSLQIIFELCKIIFSIVIRKLADRLFKNF